MQRKGQQTILTKRQVIEKKNQRAQYRKSKNRALIGMLWKRKENGNIMAIKYILIHPYFS